MGKIDKKLLVMLKLRSQVYYVAWLKARRKRRKEEEEESKRLTPKTTI
jgi:hypothetical protein